MNETKVTKTYVKDAVDALLAGKDVEITETRPIGCGISYEEVKRRPRPGLGLEPSDIDLPPAADPSLGGGRSFPDRPTPRRPLAADRPDREDDRVRSPSRRLGLLACSRSALALGVAGLLDAPAPADDEVTLVPVKYDDFLARIAANKKAKFTIVDAWATWCGPCKENFPHLVEMHKKYADKGLAVVSLSLDDPDQPKKVAEATGVPQGEEGRPSPTSSSTRDRGRLREARHQRHPGRLPLSAPTARRSSGSRWTTSNNQFTYDQVEKAVEDCLDGKPIERRGRRE